MRVQITLPGKEAKKMKEKLMPLLSKVETEDYNGNECQMVRTYGNPYIPFWCIFRNVWLNLVNFVSLGICCKQRPEEGLVLIYCHWAKLQILRNDYDEPFKPSKQLIEITCSLIVVCLGKTFIFFLIRILLGIEEGVLEPSYREPFSWFPSMHRLDVLTDNRGHVDQEYSNAWEDDPVQQSMVPLCSKRNISIHAKVTCRMISPSVSIQTKHTII